MSSEPTGTVPFVLTLLERRVLGVLVEKAKTTPDVYPMSLNALVSGCNQKSNRDPVMNLNEDQIEQTLLALRSKGLVMQVIGGRVDRWRQQLYDAWLVSKLELAILAELFLRGPQTEAELRRNADRMEPFADAEALKATLKPLVERKFVIYLGEENRRGTLVTHGFHDPRELERPKVSPGAAMEREVVVPTVPAILAPNANHLEVQIVELKAAVAALQEELRQFKADFVGFRQSLGG